MTPYQNWTFNKLGFDFLAAIASLLEAAADSNISVVEIVNTSLHKIADKHTNEVLNTCCQFGQNISKTNRDHLASVLNIIQRICEDFIQNLQPETVSLLTTFALDIMTQNAVYEPNVQTPASETLVALGRQHTEVNFRQVRLSWYLERYDPLFRLWNVW